MSDEKICPFMSRPSVAYVNDDGIAKFQFAPVCCQKEQCAAWVKINRRFDGNGDIVEESFGCRLIP